MRRILLLICILWSFCCEQSEVFGCCVKKNVVVLEPSKTLKEQLVYNNTIYEINHEFDLSKEKGVVSIPEGCTLKFKGGSLKNGILKFNNTIIDSPEKCLKRVSCSGALKGIAYARWFVDTDDMVIQSLFNISKEIVFEPGVTYNQKTTIELSNIKGLNINGNGAILKLVNRVSFQLKLKDCPNWTISDIVLDGNDRVRIGFCASNSSGGQMNNSCIRNIKDSKAEGFGIYGALFYGCSDMRFENCVVKNVEANNYGVAGGLVFWPQDEEDELIYKNISIINSRFFRILADTQSAGKGSDCVYFGGEYIKNNYINAIVENCLFEDFGKRAIKSQAKAVKVKNCTIHDSDGFVFNHHSAIQFFGSDSEATDNIIDLKNSTYGISIYSVPKITSDKSRIIIDSGQFINNVTIKNNNIKLIGNSLIAVGLENDNVCRYDNITIAGNSFKTENALSAIAVRGRGKNLIICDNTIFIQTQQQGPSANYGMDGIDVYQRVIPIVYKEQTDNIDCFHENVTIDNNIINGTFQKAEAYNSMNTNGIYAIGKKIVIKNNKVSNFANGIRVSHYGKGDVLIKTNQLSITKRGVVTSSESVRIISNEFNKTSVEDVSFPQGKRIKMSGNKWSLP